MRVNSDSEDILTVIWTVILTVILVHMYKKSIYLTVKTFNSDFCPYIKNYVHIMGSHIVSTLKAHVL